MRRFLVVGCGGSGGATLSYMMDQLSSDLAAQGVHQLPAGWQFLQIDVPSGAEPGPDGLGNVPQQGGRYLGLGPKGGSYTDLDYAISQKLLATQSLETLGTWAPREPRAVSTPIDTGAGQYRSIGRMITLARSEEILQALRGAWNDLNRVETTTEMSRLASAMGSTFDPQEPPIILVVTSMAGGSGASMALDVCRLLTLVPGVNPKLMAVFMVSSDIFDTLPPSARSGVRANALAMLGEIVSSQAGSARRHDVDTLAGLGHRDGEGIEIPFARVFPVGRFIGAQRTLFGDGSPKAVYRGLARGLSGVMVSEVASQQFVAYDLGNTGSVPPDTRYLAWGAQQDPIPWGSFGFASLSMGRDRYAEYAAQRISRGAVDRLLDGHLQPGNQASGTEQVKALLDSQWAGICNSLRLPVGAASAQQASAELGSWMTTVALPREDAEAAARLVTETDFSPHIPSPQGQQARQWLETVRQKATARGPALTEAAGQSAYRWVYAWQAELLRRTEAVVAKAVATLGLSYAGALVDRLETHLREIVIPGTDGLSRGTSVDVTELPAEVRDTLAATKGAISGGDTIIAKVVNGVRIKVRTQIYLRASGLMAETLKTYNTDVLQPLVAGIRESQRVLEQARASQAKHDGLARLTTDQYSAWPSDTDTQVPRRFDEANNEVLLTTSREFPAQYDADLQRSVPNSEPGTARATVLTQVIEGIWESTGGVQPPGGLLQRTQPWRPRTFATEPVSGDPIIPSQARFDVHVRPSELLARARMFVAREEQSFQRFCAVSLRDYLTGSGTSTGSGSVEQGERVRDIVTKFTETLSLAMPLISVDDQTVQMLHGGRPVEYRYKFSDVPFAELAVASDLEGVIRGNPTIDASSLSNLQTALTDQGNPRRIDVFGSYPLYSPLVFESVLKPVAEQWGSTSPQGREAFWSYRRARPLDAALPMSVAERRALVAGWYIGQMVGEIKIPEPPYTAPVEIFDADAGRWVAFPNPLLTPPQKFMAQYDWLPAVLESSLLAISRVHEAPVLSSLQPYQLLRGLYDSAELGPAGGIVPLSAKQKLSGWLRDGSTSGAPSRVPSLEAATTAEERLAAAHEWIKGPGDLAGTHFMPPGHDNAPGGGTFSVIQNRAQAAQTPYFRDLAVDIWWATARIDQLLDEAYQLAQQSTGQGGGPAAAGGNSDIQIPEGGVF